MDQLVGSDESSSASSDFIASLACFKTGLLPHWFLTFIALFPYCHPTGLHHMHDLPLWLAQSMSRHGWVRMLRQRTSHRCMRHYPQSHKTCLSKWRHMSCTPYYLVLLKQHLGEPLLKICCITPAPLQRQKRFHQHGSL